MPNQFASNQLTRRELYRGLEGTFDSQLEMELFHQKFAVQSNDAKEGPRALIEKRAPELDGKGSFHDGEIDRSQPHAQAARQPTRCNKPSLKIDCVPSRRRT